MALSNCEIIFLNNPHGVFYTGDTVTGKFKMILDQIYKIQGLELKIKGDAKSRWTESRNSGKNRKTVVFRGFQEILNISTNLLAGGVCERGETELHPGVHNFDFSFSLPQGIPSSYKGNHGKIKYVISVTCKRAYSFNKTYKLPFTVITRVDLNFNPQYRLPIKHEMSKKFYFFFSKNGELNVEVNLPASGFVPGQNIPIQSRIKNFGKVRVLEVIFSLQQVTVYSSTQPYTKSRSETNKVSHVSGGGVRRNEELINNAFLNVPSVPPSSVATENCIISNSYVVKVKVKVSGMHMNLIAFVPITIGTVPLYNSIDEPPSPSAPPYYDALAPPTYEDTMMSQRMMEVDNEDDDWNAYNPKYPVYQFNSNLTNSDKN